MPLSAVFFGAIGTLAETSDLQRRAFNRAFARAGLDWEWEDAPYREMLKQPGGKARIARYAEERGEEVDAEALYAAKTRAFAEMVQPGSLRPRAGVTDLIAVARSHGLKLGFVTATSVAQRDLVLEGLAPAVTRGDFAYLGDRARVTAAKPAPDIYIDALRSLGLTAGQAIAIEDTPESAEAALAAGIETIGFPGPGAAGRAFPHGVEVVERLSPDLILSDRVKAA